MPTVSEALQGFIDDEILRAPLLVEQVVDAAHERLQKGVSTMALHERTAVHDVMAAASQYRSLVVDAYVESLRRQVMADDALPAATATEAKLSLSLVDEGEVAVDVAISHTIEAIRSTCEYELRELQTYVSALVGDMEVARDHNPFRPETHARALWASLQVLPLSRGHRLTFLRQAGVPLAQVLRKSYAAASSRLESMGVEPATHRTVILAAGGSRRHDASYAPDLHRIRETMPVPSNAGRAAHVPLEQALQLAIAQLRSLPEGAGLTEHDQLLRQQRVQLVESATSKVDQQLIELFGRLFDAMLSDRLLHPDIQLLLSRLQASALRVALADPKTLDDRDHALWRFIDGVAFYGEILPPSGDPIRAKQLRFVQGLIEHLVGEPRQDAALYAWGLERLAAHHRVQLERRVEAAEEQIGALQTQEDRIANAEPPTTTMSGALDVGQLDTVPASLIGTVEAVRKPAADAEAWLGRQSTGDWVRMFMQGRWVNAQIVWPSERGEFWLCADAAGPTTWAVRRRALLTLRAENLLGSLEPRSLLIDAAKRVMRRALRG